MPSNLNGRGNGRPQIRKDDIRQKHSPSDPMTLACNQFADLLTPKELATYEHEHVTVKDLESEVTRLETHKLMRSKTFRIGKRIQPLVEFLKRHSEAMDTMVQANPFPAALVWGSFKVLLTSWFRFTFAPGFVEGDCFWNVELRHSGGTVVPL
ncbi:hypothetical protein AA313_de0201543 [Arthrobotrys entomopaga]|nr:hypothetical protein AA313_de0201543 [Arthrobotrys entomopaga]